MLPSKVENGVNCEPIFTHYFISKRYHWEFPLVCGKTAKCESNVGLVFLFYVRFFVVLHGM